MGKVCRTIDQINRENCRVCEGHSRLPGLHNRGPNHSSQVRLPRDYGTLARLF